MNDILPLKSILITGGAGFIGANLTIELIKLNYDIHLILKKSTDLWRIKNILDKIKIYYIDLLDKNKLTKTIKRINPNFIIHLATYSNYRNQSDVKQMIEVNIKGLLNLLIASKDINYRMFINTGSSSEYGIKNEPMNEDDMLAPISFYATTKASATLLCQVFAREYQKPIVTLRPFSVYGPYENNTRFIPNIINAVINNKSIKLTRGRIRRDFIYVNDIVDIYIKAMNKGKKLQGQIINMGTGVEYTNDQVVKTLLKVTGKKVKIEKGAYPKRIWDTPHWVADISKTKKLLRWKPKFSLEKGLEETYEWYLKLYEK